MRFAAVPSVLLALQRSEASSSECVPRVIAGFDSGVVRLLHLCKGSWQVVAASRLHEGESIHTSPESSVVSCESRTAEASEV